MSSSLYRPLKPNEFRLLKLSQDVEHEGGVTLSYSLETFSTRDAPDYQALSYCWGKPEPAQTIQINRKHTLNIGPDLHHALKAFRLWETRKSPGWIWFDRDQTVTCPEWIWIDQICINQEDNADKSAQIGMMGDIYSRATLVTIWVGSRYRVMEPAPYLSYEPKKDAAEASGFDFVDFTWAPWYRRIWTLQEVILARNARVVHECGVEDWRVLTSHLRNLGKSSNPHDPLLLISDVECLIPFENLTRCRELNDTRRYDLELLALVRNRGCIEPSDRIYGVLQLFSSEIRRQVTIDTTLHHHMVFRDFAKIFLQHHGPDLFIIAPGVLYPRPENGLPSWVPDLTAPALMTHTWSRYRAGKTFRGTAPEPNLRGGGDDTVQIPGLRMASIQEVWQIASALSCVFLLDDFDYASAGEERHRGRYKDARDFIKCLIGEIYQTIHPRSQLSLPGIVKNAIPSGYTWPSDPTMFRDPDLKLDFGPEFSDPKLMSILTGGILYPEWLGNGVGHNEAFAELIRALDSDLPIRWGGRNAGLFLSSMAEAWQGAHMFAAAAPDNDTVLIGIGPQTMRIGDEVFIFFRGSTPVIMRRCEETDDTAMVVPNGMATMEPNDVAATEPRSFPICPPLRTSLRNLKTWAYSNNLISKIFSRDRGPGIPSNGLAMPQASPSDSKVPQASSSDSKVPQASPSDSEIPQASPCDFNMPLSRSYKVLGPAYVDEYMDGSAFEARNPLEYYEMVTIK
ncbi:heterokaryon incompatibility protein-domain-containing protein [Triangularia verruculosa]|uniref:Heterokaryon incompatibility protein-domain-containing protein n=1 Tax=Triangularia verruculosa TaxID=2587418 RepID=A0AAN6XL75_9PEZI|nr:heterokaryon incompatibility protein-domain-containing protein [Triangularia verruculosa]